ncbi:hypothetical protein PZ938_12655 [Luteipulveratus sp. YIM 133132]|uniref:hypothetical protein n=1 Tax=Luteipulveratus flavus TaxID=3031728 RepID=UPI0023AF5DC8|nr:hypothetical protein [Luteipulveratus sp. YIM 133132]MDE9366455.1 hypothetical protein [Luteipulveratus sp. YIM 133132]
MRLTHLIPDAERHGVTIHARRLAAHVPGSTTAGWPDTPPDGFVIIHFTERLWRTATESALEVVRRATGRAERLAVVMHDLPQPSDGEHYPQRQQLFAQVTELADLIVVSSEFERGLLLACLRDRGDAGRHRVAVLPLPVDHPDTTPPARVDRTIATLGFLYPGKGVEDVLVAAAQLPQPPAVINLGGAAPGHADVVDHLAELADQHGVTWRASGWLSADELAAAMREVGVPVAPHRHMSASGSINTWLEAGRRPLVAPTPYARELGGRHPGAITLISDLTRQLADALDRPSTTWVSPGQEVGLSWEQAGRDLAALVTS